MSLRISLIAAALAALAPLAAAQFATAVLDYSQGDISAGGVFNPANVLGGPRGGGAHTGSADVLSLGRGGSVTLGFSTTLRDGPGVDLTVFENPFFDLAAPPFHAFSEVVFVEVSSNGVDFARFPSRYAGPPGPLPPFGVLPLGAYDGLAGATPVLANVVTNAIDPLDPTVSGGESFDLADLAADPLVTAGLVDLSAVAFVRLVDVVAGTDTDSLGVPIEDHGGFGSADIDAVALIHQAGNAAPGEPRVEISFDGAGFQRLAIEDPDGLADLDPASFRFTFNLIPVAPATLGQLFQVVAVSATRVELSSVIPFTGFGVFGVFSVAIRDLSGSFTADQAALQG